MHDEGPLSTYGIREALPGAEGGLSKAGQWEDMAGNSEVL